MNYFAHGLAHIDRPCFLAGTAVPDWLGVVDRKLRVRAIDVLPFVDGSGSPTDQFAAGILKHLKDDEWFHATTGFANATREMTDSFRGQLTGNGENYRTSFWGHIATELILDGHLIEQNPSRLGAYYSAIASVDADWIENTLSRFLGRDASGLAWFVRRFLESRFLFDYLDASRLLYRLNQVAGRIKLRPLPEKITSVIHSGRRIVERNFAELLPEEHFPFT